MVVVEVEAKKPSRKEPDLVIVYPPDLEVAVTDFSRSGGCLAS